MADHDHLDDRIRAAWADLDDDDRSLDPAPAPIWAAIASATNDSAVPPDVDAAPPSDAGDGVRRRRLWALGAAAVVLVALALGAVIVRASGDAGPVESRATLSTEGLPVEPGPHGDARITGAGDGRRIEVDLADLPDLGDDEVFEVWLIDPDSGGLQSLGLVEDGAALAVPGAIDTDRFSVVDISIEPTDGDPGHSSDSVLRGALEPV